MKLYKNALQDYYSIVYTLYTTHLEIQSILVLIISYVKVQIKSSQPWNCNMKADIFHTNRTACPRNPDKP